MTIVMNETEWNIDRSKRVRACIDPGGRQRTVCGSRLGSCRQRCTKLEPSAWAPRRRGIRSMRLSSWRSRRPAHRPEIILPARAPRKAFQPG